MPDPIRFVMLGGFLGAGKTTTIAKLARHYQSQGKHVVIVTNDQADHLVDTELLRSQGFEVGEVAGSCFCCNFNGLTGQMEKLSAAQRPDVILAEPVGSCTDLIATIAAPMMSLLGEDIEVAPYAVLIKPSHGRKILTGAFGRGFSPKAEYIFRKQVEEANLIVINRIDELSESEINDLESALSDQYPGRPILRLSAKDGTHIEELVSHLAEGTPDYDSFMDVDYDIYAEGEAELGWLNATALLRSADAKDLDELLVQTLETLKAKLGERDAETAHLKAIIQAGKDTAVANLVSSDTAVTLSMPSGTAATEARMVVNARVAIDPEVLSKLVRETLLAIATSTGWQLSIESLQSFRPDRPVPTHRAV
ncbi:MAG: GTP-binding protein [Planctomycetota bacterium]